MRNLNFLILLFTITFYQCQSQTKENSLYLRQELVRQRDNLLTQAKEIQTRIDALDKKLNTKTNYISEVNYLSKNINYKIENSSPLQSIYNSKKKHYRSTSSKTYHRGSRGGCYYINSNGNKSYVDRSMCN